jgi:hypothetical protein
MPQVGDIYMGVDSTGAFLHSAIVTAVDLATGMIEITQDWGSRNTAENPEILIIYIKINSRYPGFSAYSEVTKRWEKLKDQFWTQRPLPSTNTPHSPGGVPVPDRPFNPNDGDRSPPVR